MKVADHFAGAGIGEQAPRLRLDRLVRFQRRVSRGVDQLLVWRRVQEEVRQA
jgi:hypothetical protein